MTSNKLKIFYTYLMIAVCPVKLPITRFYCLNNVPTHTEQIDARAQSKKESVNTTYIFHYYYDL